MAITDSQAILAGAGASALTGLGNLGLGLWNSHQQKDMWQQEFDYAKALQQQEWDRQDTALSRSVADAKRAGLSPLAALGSSGLSSGSIVQSPGVPSIPSPRFDAPGLNLDTALDYVIAKRRLEHEDKKLGVMQTENELDREFDREKVKAELDNAVKISQANLEQSQDQFTKSQAQALEQFNSTLLFQMSVEDRQVAMSNQRMLMERFEALSRHTNLATGGMSSNFKVYTDWNKYQADFLVWNQAYAQQLLTSFNVADSYSSSTNRSASQGGGVDFGVKGLGVGGTRNDSSSSGIAESEDFTTRNEARIKAWFMANPMPVFKYW